MASTGPDIERLVREQLATWRDEQFSGFEDATLAWLAMVPAWTVRLAVAAGFPTGLLSLPEFLERAERAGICEREQRDQSAESNQRSVSVLSSLWPRLDEQQRQKLAPLFQKRAEAQPAGAEQTRILRELAPYLDVQTGFLSTFLRRSPTPRSSDCWGRSGRASATAVGSQR